MFVRPSAARLGILADLYEVRLFDDSGAEVLRVPISPSALPHSSHQVELLSAARKLNAILERMGDRARSTLDRMLNDLG